MTDPSTSSASLSRSLHAQAWAEAYTLIDRQLSPLGQRAMGGLALFPGAVVLDIGCGTGQSICQLAELVGATGRVVGVDVARQLLEIAERRTRSLDNVSLIEADAQTLGLDPGSLDAVYSRFGVMGFAIP